MEDVINAMHNKEVAGALLDIYAAATKKSMFQGGDIQLNRLIEYPTGYGFALSGDMAKAAPLFRQALAARKTQISLIVEENTDSISIVSIFGKLSLWVSQNGDPLEITLLLLNVRYYTLVNFK